MSGNFRTKFNNEWISDAAFSPWIEPVPADPYKTRCGLFRKAVELSNMGRQAVMGHKTGAKHRRNITSST